MIPFNVPYVPEASKRYVLEALEGKHQQGDGPFTAKASKMVSDLVGGGHVLLTPSCTHALEMASMLVNIGPGDEVILPSYTFTSAATAITKFGATPIFVDIEMDTKGINVNQAREAISPRTKAISWVNYAGVAPDIEGLQSLAKEFNVLLIEDNAHGLGGSYKGKPLGSFGDFATQSFHATKNIQCGEGGALVINNLKYIERAEIIREKGTDRSRFIRGEIQKYQWVDKGSSYLLAELLAANLCGQLEDFLEIQNNRLRYKSAYQSVLSPLLESNRVLYSKTPIDSTDVSHMFYLYIQDADKIEIILKHFSDLEIPLHGHYQPLHNSIANASSKLSTKKDFSITNNVSRSIYRLPLWSKMDENSLAKILEAIETLKP